MCNGWAARVGAPDLSSLICLIFDLSQDGPPPGGEAGGDGSECSNAGGDGGEPSGEGGEGGEGGASAGGSTP